jgi:hypothetical protein
MNTCSICLETDTKETHTTNCGHIFHKSCISTWLKEKNSCPMCRKEQIIMYMIHSINITKENPDYKITQSHEVGEQELYLDETTFKCAYEQLLNQVPQGWVNIDSGEESSPIAPVYILEEEGREVFIDYYFRQLLLFNEGEIDTTKIVEKRGIDTVYYTSTQNLNRNGKNITPKEYSIMVEWIYEVMCTLKIEYSFSYKSSMNSILLDLVTMTIMELEMAKRSTYQTAIIAAIYITINFYEKKEVSREKLIWYTDNSSEMSVLNNFIHFQDIKVENNISKVLEV